MAQIFPRWANQTPRYLLIGAGAATLAGVAIVWFFFSPAYTDVGYQPRQPVPFSHTLHAGDLDVDCRYCHASVEIAAVASIPPTQTCMNCHVLVGRSSDTLAAVRDSLGAGEPLRWIRVHKLPDYAYFDHGAHVRAGVGCVSCHGDVATMDEIQQVQPLSMRWCLDCHRDPVPSLLPRDQVTRSGPPRADATSIAASVGHPLTPPSDCSGCHR
jgi:hypothetical protein